MKKRIYTVKDIENIQYIHKQFPEKSIRSIAEFSGIPKSVVGRWVKEPKVWKEHYRFNIPDTTNLSPKRAQALKKFEKKVNRERKEDKNKYQGLYISYGDSDYEAYSG